MKRLYLNAVITVPSEEAEKRIQNLIETHSNQEDSIYRDEFGRSIEDYENLNVKLPKDFLKNSKDFLTGIDDEGMVMLEEHELEYEFYDYILNADYFVDAVDNPEIGCMITLSNGLSIHVAETAEEVNICLAFLYRSFMDKVKDYFLSFFRRKNKIQEEINN